MNKAFCSLVLFALWLCLASCGTPAANNNNNNNNNRKLRSGDYQCGYYSPSMYYNEGPVWRETNSKGTPLSASLPIPFLTGCTPASASVNGTRTMTFNYEAGLLSDWVIFQTDTKTLHKTMTYSPANTINTYTEVSDARNTTSIALYDKQERLSSLDTTRSYPGFEVASSDMSTFLYHDPSCPWLPTKRGRYADGFLSDVALYNYTLDDAGLIVSYTESVSSPTENTTRSYTLLYNSLGSLLTVSNDDGSTNIKFSYDDTGRVVESVDQSGTGSPQVTELSWDDEGGIDTVNLTLGDWSMVFSFD